MAVNLFIRKTFSANALKKAVNESLNPKVRALKKDKQLAKRIATEWAERVNRFVPRSEPLPGQEDIPEKKHLQSYTVSDGRVIWSRIAIGGSLDGQQIAHLLYEGPIVGQFHSRTSSKAQPHEPQAHWDQLVTPGTKDWDDFVTAATPIIKEWMRKNNG